MINRFKKRQPSYFHSYCYAEDYSHQYKLTLKNTKSKTTARLGNAVIIFDKGLEKYPHPPPQCKVEGNKRVTFFDDEPNEIGNKDNLGDQHEEEVYGDEEYELCDDEDNASNFAYPLEDMSFPTHHSLNDDRALQRAMSGRERPTCRTRGPAAPEYNMQAGLKSMPVRSSVNLHLKYRHTMSELKKDAFRDWVYKHSHSYDPRKASKERLPNISYATSKRYNLIDKPPRPQYASSRRSVTPDKSNRSPIPNDESLKINAILSQMMEAGVSENPHDYEDFVKQDEMIFNQNDGLPCQQDNIIYNQNDGLPLESEHLEITGVKADTQCTQARREEKIRSQTAAAMRAWQSRVGAGDTTELKMDGRERWLRSRSESRDRRSPAKSGRPGFSACFERKNENGGSMSSIAAQGQEPTDAATRPSSIVSGSCRKDEGKTYAVVPQCSPQPQLMYNVDPGKRSMNVALYGKRIQAAKWVESDGEAACYYAD